jgi:hypothetical protein
MPWSMIYSSFFTFPLLFIIPPLLDFCLSRPREVRHSPDWATHCHTSDLKSGTSSLTRLLTPCKVIKFSFQLYITYEINVASIRVTIQISHKVLDQNYCMAL